MPRGNSAGLRLKESIPVGVTFYSSTEVDDIVEFFGDFWHGNDYDPFLKNCNHFTHTLVAHLCHQENFYYPRYVNRFTKMGSMFRMWFKPLQELVGDLVNYKEEEEEEQISEVEQNPLPLYLRPN